MFFDDSALSFYWVMRFVLIIIFNRFAIYGIKIWSIIYVFCHMKP